MHQAILTHGAEQRVSYSKGKAVIGFGKRRVWRDENVANLLDLVRCWQQLIANNPIGSAAQEISEQTINQFWVDSLVDQNVHASEYSSVGLDYDHTVDNNGTIDDLHKHMELIVNG